MDSNRKRIRRWIAKLREYLGLERNVLVMTVSNNIKGLGSGLWTSYLPKMLETLGATGPMIGVFGTIGAGTSVLFSFLGGAISDRLGRGRALIFSAAVSLFGYLIYLFSPVWWLFIPGSVFLTAGAYFFFMGFLALIGETVDPNRRAVSMAAQGLINVPVAMVAPILGGLFIESLGMVNGFRLSLALTVGFTIVAILLQSRLYRLPPAAVKKMSLNLRTAWAATRPELRSLLLANCLMSFGFGMYSMFTVLYVMNIVGASAIHYGILQAVSSAAGTILSIPVGKLSDRKGMQGRKPYVMIMFLLTAIYPLLLVLVPSTGWLFPIFLMWGVRQSFDLARKAMIVDLAGSRERGRVLGVYFLINGLAAFPSSFVAGWLYQWRATAPFLIGSCISFLGFLIFLWRVPSRSENTV